MILEAFASYLKAADQQLPATYVLARWLWERLSLEPTSQVDHVLHEEIAVKHRDATNKERLVFRPDVAPATAYFPSQAPGKSVSARKECPSLATFLRLYRLPDKNF